MMNIAGEKMEEPYVHKVFTGKMEIFGDLNAVDPFDQQWQTAIFKTATEDKIWLSETGLAGDEGDSKNIDQAAFAYPIKHYTYWKKEIKIENIDAGGMGENLAVLEMDEFSVCIGDIYQFGDAIIQVAAPKLPNWHMAKRFKVADLALHMQNTGRTGWYFRVLKSGDVLSRIDIELIERPYPQWSVAACNEIMHLNKNDLRLADDLASCHLLAKGWRETLLRRLRGQEESAEKRIYGPFL